MLVAQFLFHIKIRTHQRLCRGVSDINFEEDDFFAKIYIDNVGDVMYNDKDLDNSYKE